MTFRCLWGLTGLPCQGQCITTARERRKISRKVQGPKLNFSKVRANFEREWENLHSCCAKTTKAGGSADVCPIFPFPVAGCFSPDLSFPDDLLCVTETLGAEAQLPTLLL